VMNALGGVTAIVMTAAAAALVFYL
jgi:hypothetical protein